MLMFNKKSQKCFEVLRTEEKSILFYSEVLKKVINSSFKIDFILNIFEKSKREREFFCLTSYKLPSIYFASLFWINIFKLKITYLRKTEIFCCNKFFALETFVIANITAIVFI